MTNTADAPPPSSQSTQLERNAPTNNPFIQWLTDGIRDSKTGFEFNNPTARLHKVDAGLLLISPAIFKDFSFDEWRKHQRAFWKLGIHEISSKNNIHHYTIEGSEKLIKGILIADPESKLGITINVPNNKMLYPVSEQ